MYSFITHISTQTECQACAIGGKCKVCTSSAADACIVCAGSSNMIVPRSPPYCGCSSGFFDAYPTSLDC